MADHFGGNWTITKLRTLNDYLEAYKKIFDKNLKAQSFTTHYIDAFAGKGDLVFEDSIEGNLFEMEAHYPGSAKIALDIKSPFHHYHFIEKDRSRCQKLEELKRQYAWAKDRVHIYNGDCTQELTKILKSFHITKDRAVIFLDPFGMHVEFDLLKTIAKTKMVDLWILVPHAVGFMRQLQKDGEIIDSVRGKLDRVFGETDWFEKFYKEYSVENLFGEEETILIKAVNEKELIEYYVSRLGEIFHKVAPNPLILKNTKNIPIFALCFAASNEKGSETAINIARHLIEKKHG
ncbi:MAG: three-Cys-motif partner protein TcmP [Ignavibacteria bacterium]|nr:three-Cys-motif partner protein TcmP [Ignavibacteria bacterium]